MIKHGSSPQDFWREIVLRTEGLESDTLRSIRIALFISLWTTKDRGFWFQAAPACRALLALLSFERKQLPETARRGLVFCFAHQSPSNMNNLLPLAREAQRRGILSGIVSAAESIPALDEFREFVPIFTKRDLVARLSVRQRWAVGAEALRILRRASRVISQYDASLMIPLRRNLGSILREIMTSLEMEKALPALYQSWMPMAVISTSDMWPFEYQFALQASANKIPSYVIQHGSLAYFYWPFVADYYILWGQQSRDEMLALGADPSRLLVGGMPAADPMFARYQQPGQQERVGGKTPVCVILSHTHVESMEPGLYRQFGLFLSAAVRLASGIKWKVKLHPAEDRSFYDRLPTDVTDRLEFYPKSSTLNDALAEADVVTTLYSTAGQESMVYGLPVVVPVVSPRMEEPHSLPQVPGARHVHDPQEFIRVIKYLVMDPVRRDEEIRLQRASLQKCFANQGNSVGKIMDLIEQNAVFSGTEERRQSG